MAERKNNQNTFVDYAFKASFFVLAFSIVFSLFISINSTKNIAYAVVTDNNLLGSVHQSQPFIDLSCKITSNNQTGWYGTYFNYSSTTPGMELPTSQWHDSYGDPLSVFSPFTASWYDSQYSRFSRVDSNLNFGSNFYPFNTHPEELINDKEYHFGVRWEAEVFATSTGNYDFTTTSDDDVWIYVNGQLVGDNSGVHADKTLNGSVSLNQGSNLVQIFFAERHVIQSTMSFSFNDSSLLIKPYSNICPKNTPPTITLVGANPATTTVGTTFTDPGATATDLEDGDLTSQIVVTGTVDSNTVGTYTLTYTVTDTGGLTASTTRQVVVEREPIVPPVTPSTIKINIIATKIVCNTESDLPNWGLGGPDVSSTTATDFIASHPNCHLELDWKFQWASSTTTDPGKAFIGEATGWNTFGPTNINGIATTSVDLATSTNHIWVREVLKSGYIPFTFPTNNNDNVSAEMYCHTDVLNYDNYDRVDGPFVQNKNYNCIAFNVLKTVVPPTNTPPTITLVGANPATTTVGTTFTDPGATATDLEDGDLTSQIVVTGTVDSNTVGTYTLTYTVTDTGGLTASTTRQVVVESIVIPSNRKINVCLVLVDENNNVATSSYELPQGQFSVDLGKAGVGATTTFSWDANTFNPNRKTILGVNDSDCQEMPNLDIADYLYTEVATTGPAWKSVAKYSDQYDQPVNNVFDFFPYKSGNPINQNSDGIIIITQSRGERTLVLLVPFDSNYVATNTPPTITLVGANPATTTVGTTFTDPGATATDLEDGDLTSQIVVTGTVDSNTVGTYTLTYTVTDTGGLTASTTRQVVVTSGGGGGGPQCLIPEITSPLTASVQVNSAFSYTLTASSTATTTLNVATSTLPAGLTYSNGVISGTPTSVGTYSITIEAGNSCGLRTETLVLTVTQVPTPPACSSNCGGGGGGGGGGNGPIIPSLTIFNEYVQEIEPGVAMVSWNTNLPATRQVVYGNSSQTVVGLAPLYGYTSDTEKILTPLSTTHSMVVPIDPDKVYYFRPVSGDNNVTIVGKELNITRGGTPIVGGSCYYLYDFLRKDFNNNPVEVRKLQVFLNSFEGANLQVTGIYDDATIVEVNAFQDKYKADILTPWGHTAPTAYTYILTKKKVNEIYCQKAFPVTTQEQNEIDEFKVFLSALGNEGIEINDGIVTPPENPVSTPIQNEIIGLNSGNTGGNENGTSTITTLAGVSSTTRNIVSNLTANVLEGGKVFLNLALGMFGWPLFDINDENVGLFSGEVQSKWLILFLVLLIMAILYFWHRERKNNKKIDEINKEIDLDK